MNTNENPLESLEFLDLLSGEDPIDAPSYDPNKNIAPDILSGKPLPPPDENLDDDEEDDSSNSNIEPPASKTQNQAPADEPADEDELLDEGDDDDINYFETFGKGLIKAGMLEIEDGEDPEQIEWTEETFLSKMEQTIEKKAWDTLESIALETYGDAGVKLVEDLFINKVPVSEYLTMFRNEEVVANIDLNSEMNQERVVRLYLAKTGMEEEEIEDQIAYAKDNERLPSYAKKYHGKLLERMESERQVMADESAARVQVAQQKEQDRQELYAGVLEKSIKDGSIEGYPINENSAGELFDFVLAKSVQLPNGQKISEFEYKLAVMRQEDPSKFLAVARLVQNNLDLTPIKNRGVSEATNSIFNELRTKTKKPAKSSRSEQDMFSRYFK
jgi:hypothetical protein